MKKMIFIIGTGRSGTHLIGRTVSSHPKIDGFIEHPNFFILSALIGAFQDIAPFSMETMLKKRLAKRYLKELEQNPMDFVMDKSHANIWIAEYLAKKIPNSLFVGVYRDALPTVSSMLKHKDVMRWYKILPQARKNRFLGITDANKKSFRNFSIEEKCVQRWASHREELFRLRQVLPKDRYMLIKYEEFMNKPGEFLQELASFIGIDNSFEYEKLEEESLDKWKSNLGKTQIKNVLTQVELFENGIT